MQHRLMIIGSLRQNIPLVHLAKARGYYTVVCDGYEDGPAKREADKAYTVDVRDVGQIAQICKSEQIDGIIGSFSDLVFEQITKIADLAGLRWYAKPDQLKYYREKNEAKKLLSSLGVRVPKNCVLGDHFRDEDLDGFTFPLVIKPVNGWGSRGIFVVNSISEIRQHFETVKNRIAGIPYIEVEEYSKGREYNVTSWLSEGKVHLISIADREKNPRVGDQIPMVNRVAYPSRNVRVLHDQVVEVLQKFADAVGQKEGVLSMQCFFNEHGVEVCEIAGRIFGYEHEMITMCCGLSMEKLLLDYVYEPEQVAATLAHHNPFFDRCYCGLYFFGRHGAKVADQSGLRAAAKDPAVTEAFLSYQEGETVDNFSSRSYYAQFTLRAKNHEELDEATDRIFSTVSAKADDGTELMAPCTREQL